MKNFKTALALAAFIGFTAPATAFELNGAWGSQGSTCDKMFKRTGNAISFVQDSDIYGNGFIVDGNNIQAQAGKCTVKARKEAGEVRHLIAACSIGIMTDQMQLSYKVVDDNTIVRLFPGMEGFETTYLRCPTK